VKRSNLCPGVAPGEASGMARIDLTDRSIGSDKRYPVQARVDYFDAIVPGLALRVTSRGTEVLSWLRGIPSIPRRALGDYGEITLEEAAYVELERIAHEQCASDR
jgi:hypothetical protein